MISLTDSSVFKNAAKIINSDDLVVKDSFDACIVFSVVDPKSRKEHFVTIKYDDEARVIKAMCTCTIQSLKIKHLPLCSHIVAANYFLVNQKLGGGVFCE